MILEPLVKLEILVQQVQLVRLDQLVLKDHLDQLVHLEILEPQEQLVNLDQLETMVNVVQLVTLEAQEMMVTTEMTA